MNGPVFNQEYLRRLTEGDEPTARSFFDHFSSVLGLKLRSQGFPPDVVADVRQETLCRVWRLLKQGKKIDNLGAYVNTVCNNVVFENLRSQQRYQGIPEDMPELAGENWNPEGGWVTHDSKKAVKRILDGLPDKDRRLLQGLYIEERDKDDLCREFDVDREYLRVMIHRATSKARGIAIERPPALEAGA